MEGRDLYHLLDETICFNELKRRLSRITQRMLTRQLRELEADGLIHREIYAEVPPRVEYSLTALGRSLEPVVRMLVDMGQSVSRDGSGSCRCGSTAPFRSRRGSRRSLPAGRA